MYLLMAADTQTLQIFLVIRAAIGKWQFMMHQSRHHVFPLAVAPLAQRMSLDVPVTDFPPPLIVSLVMVIATGKMLIVSLHQLAVLFAVTALVVGKLGAAAEPAGPLWFHRHRIHLDSGHKKTSAGIAPLGGLYFFTRF